MSDAAAQRALAAKQRIRHGGEKYLPVPEAVHRKRHGLATYERRARQVKREWQEEDDAPQLPVKTLDGRVKYARTPVTHEEKKDEGRGPKRPISVLHGDASTPAGLAAAAASRRAAAEAAAAEVLEEEGEEASDWEEEEEMEAAASESDQGAPLPKNAARGKPRAGAGVATGADGAHSALGEGGAELGAVDGVKTYAHLLALPARELAARRATLKVLIADYCERILSSPDHHVSDASMKEAKLAVGGSGDGERTKSRRSNTLLLLHQLCGDADPVIRKMAMLSCVAIFRDIVPGYRVRVPTEAELAARVKKDVRKQRDFEMALLNGYQRFLKFLEVTATRGEAAARKVAKRRASGKADSVAESMDEGGGASGVGGFEVDAHDDNAVASALRGEKLGGKVPSAKRQRIGDKTYASMKKDERKAAKAERLALGAYDADEMTLHSLGVTAVQCMTELLKALTHFNFRSNLISFIVPRCHSRDPSVADMCCACVQDVFRNDATCDVSLDLVRALSDGVKAAAHKPGGMTRMSPTALATLMHLRIQHLHKSATSREGNSSGKGGGPRGGGKPSGSGDAKRSEAGNPFDADDVLAGMKAADAEALEERRANAIATLKSVITIYFRILRMRQAAHLLQPVLDGLSKYAHLIDVSVVSDLLAALKALLASSTGYNLKPGDAAMSNVGGAEDASIPRYLRARLSVATSLTCVLSAFRIMAGPGELLNADETEFAAFLYGTLLRVASPAEWQHAPLAAEAVLALFAQRREYAPERVAAFASRCMFVAAQCPAPAALALMSVCRQLCSLYPSISTMFAPPSQAVRATSWIPGATAHQPAPLARGSAGSGASAAGASGMADTDNLAYMYDPDHGQVLHSTMWSVALLQRHYHPVVRAQANAAGKVEPTTPADAAAVLFAAFDDSKGDFNPAIPLPKQHAFAAAAKARASGEAAAVSGTGEAVVAGKKRRRHQLQYIRAPSTLSSDFLVELPEDVAARMESIGGTAAGAGAPAAEGVGVDGALPAAASSSAFALHFMERLGRRQERCLHLAQRILRAHELRKAGEK